MLKNVWLVLTLPTRTVVDAVAGEVEITGHDAWVV
jgi:hypothetical protein